MAFTTITTTEIASGRPVANTTQTKVKDNFDNHESRISDLESGSAVTYPPIIFRINGKYSSHYNGIVSNLIKTTCNFNMTITGARLLIDTAGTAGSTEIDIRVKHSGSTNSIFSTKPSVAYSAGTDSLSTNQVLNGTYTTVYAGDIIMLDITASQTGGDGFEVRIDYNRA